MNKQLMLYYLGSLATSPDLSKQCKSIRTIMLDESIDDNARLENVLQFLDQEKLLEADTVRLLGKSIRGHYGGEGYVLDSTPAEEAKFWIALCDKHRDNALLCFFTADSLYLCNDDSALQYAIDLLSLPDSDNPWLPLFIQTLQLDSSLIYELEGGVVEEITKSRWRSHYHCCIYNNY